MLGNKDIGVTYVQYYSEPFPHYYLGHVQVPDDERGKGYSRLLLDDFETKLLEKGKAGVLRDRLPENNGKGSPVVGMYERRGWQRFENTNLLTFNLPSGVSKQDIGALYARKKSPVRQERLVRKANEALAKDSDKRERL